MSRVFLIHFSILGVRFYNKIIMLLPWLYLHIIIIDLYYWRLLHHANLVPMRNVTRNVRDCADGLGGTYIRNKIQL